MRTLFESYAQSDIGLVRNNNEDAWSEVPHKHFYVLADGMGGHRAGEVASYLAVSGLKRAIENLEEPPSIEEAIESLRDFILQTNRHIFTLSSQKPEWYGMGTTLCCLLGYQHNLICAHIGDSRIYQWREQSLKQISLDHSLRSSRLSKEHTIPPQTYSFYKNVLTRSMGTCNEVEPDITTLDLLPGDIYFLCSDGLTDDVDNTSIAAIIQESTSIQEATDHLIYQAKERGGHDNITILMIYIPKTMS